MWSTRSRAWGAHVDGPRSEASVEPVVTGLLSTQSDSNPNLLIRRGLVAVRDVRLVLDWTAMNTPQASSVLSRIASQA